MEEIYRPDEVFVVFRVRIVALGVCEVALIGYAPIYQSHAPPTPYRAYVGDWVGIPLRKAPHMMGLQLALDSMGSKVKASPQFSRPCGYILDSSVARSLYPYTDHLGKRRVAAS